ncbi:ribonuclease H-like domain-containing protein, partial [Tanacetum coccineum]
LKPKAISAFNFHLCFFGFIIAIEISLGEMWDCQPGNLTAGKGSGGGGKGLTMVVVIVYRHKFHAGGTLSRYKARLVANGSSHQLGVDFDKTFSLVVKLATIRTVLSLAVSLYGLKQAPHAWFQQFAGYATQDGFYHSRCDSSLFIYRQGSQVAYLLIYVDDIILTASSPNSLQQIIASLHNEFDMTNLGAFNYFLSISSDQTSTGLFLSQKKYALHLFERAHMVNCNPSWTPVDTESKLGPEGVPVQDLTLYRSLAGGLQYLTFTRCPSTRMSTSSYCIFLGDNLLSWSAKHQHTLSLSSVEAEYRGVANVVTETVWLRNLLLACRDLEAAFEYPVTHGHLSDQLLVILCGYGTKSLELGTSFLSMTMFVALDRGTRSISIVILSFKNASIDSLFLTPLCCDDIHDVTPSVFALAGCDKLVSESGYREVVMSPPARASRAKFHWGIAFETRRKHFTDPKSKLRMKHMSRRVRIPKGLYLRRIEEKLTKKQYHASGEEELTEQPRDLNKYGVDEEEPLEHEVSDKGVDPDLESTASSKPMWKKTTKADPDRASRNCPYCSK